MILNNYKKKNKIILVTGSSRGIGLNIALSLMKSNSKVIINGRKKTQLKKIVKKYPQLDYVCGDLSDIKTTKSISTEIEKKI